MITQLKKNVTLIYQNIYFDVHRGQCKNGNIKRVFKTLSNDLFLIQFNSPIVIHSDVINGEPGTCQL